MAGRCRCPLTKGTRPMQMAGSMHVHVGVEGAPTIAAWLSWRAPDGGRRGAGDGRAGRRTQVNTEDRWVVWVVKLRGQDHVGCTGRVVELLLALTVALALPGRCVGLLVLEPLRLLVGVLLPAGVC